MVDVDDDNTTAIGARRVRSSYCIVDPTNDSQASRERAFASPPNRSPKAIAAETSTTPWRSFPGEFSDYTLVIARPPCGSERPASFPLARAESSEERCAMRSGNGGCGAESNCPKDRFVGGIGARHGGDLQKLHQTAARVTSPRQPCASPARPRRSLGAAEQTC